MPAFFLPHIYLTIGYCRLANILSTHRTRYSRIPSQCSHPERTEKKILITIVTVKDCTQNACRSFSLPVSLQWLQQNGKDVEQFMFDSFHATWLAAYFLRVVIFIHRQRELDQYFYSSGNSRHILYAFLSRYSQLGKQYEKENLAFNHNISKVCYQTS